MAKQRKLDDVAKKGGPVTVKMPLKAKPEPEVSPPVVAPMPTPEPTAVSKTTFGGTEVAPVVERSTTAAAAQAKAMVEARFIMALQRPRVIDEVRTRLLRACQRPGFAQMALYAKPVGRTTVEGPSIRFADEAVKCLGNVQVDEITVFENDDERHIRVEVCDLESNLAKSTTVLVKKTIERRQPRAGQEVVSQRETSRGDIVYLLRASDDEVVVKQAALVAKARRNLELQLLPQDILEECVEAIKMTRRNRAARDPDAARKAILDGFDTLGITPANLERIVGHPLAQCSPAEVDTLRTIYATIRDGQATFADYIAQAEAQGKDTGRVRLSDLVPAEAAPEDKPPTPA